MYVFVVNPVAGNGRGKKVYHSLLKHYKLDEESINVYLTEYEGHATKLTEEVISIYGDELELIAVIGGDGTFFEVINGLKGNSNIKLSFIPTGSGNDLARGCDLGLNPYNQFERIFTKANYSPYWFGLYELDQDRENKENYFATSMGFGFDAEVAKFVNQSRMKKWLNRLRLTPLVYVYGLVVKLFIYQPKNVTLYVDGKPIQKNNIWMLTISNHPYFGGGMKIAPEATINPHHFTITVVNQISRWKLLFVFLSVFVGRHTSLKEIDTFQAREIELLSEKSISYQADGYTQDTDYCRVKKDSVKRLILRN
ncbi:diacylglycerol/lipid kinase family protein [Alkalibacillus aidingensis]|uniref:diacylglycerol/lipid kinase family protein n=1 Tax=Alkalibacillus aidingensis TaxID=2747607 RepID=UPI001660FBB2|nr:YegS/Rv2252/BmrU family lipid kinase [Alkalibacillus aidingensis]